MQFIDSARFMESSLSNPVNNLFEGIHKIKCKYRHNDKKILKLVQLNISIKILSLNTQILKMISWNTNVYFSIRIVKESKKFDNNKFILFITKRCLSF